jgi:hypothetical protein
MVIEKRVWLGGPLPPGAITTRFLGGDELRRGWAAGLPSRLPSRSPSRLPSRSGGSGGSGGSTSPSFFESDENCACPVHFTGKRGPLGGLCKDGMEKMGF